MIFSLQTDNDFLTIILFDHHFYDIFTSFGYTYIYLWNYKKFEHHLFSSDWHTHVRAIIITLISDLLIVKTIIVVKRKWRIKCGFLYRNIIRNVITTTRIRKLKSCMSWLHIYISIFYLYTLYKSLSSKTTNISHVVIFLVDLVWDENFLNVFL